VAVIFLQLLVVTLTAEVGPPLACPLKKKNAVSLLGALLADCTPQRCWFSGPTSISLAPLLS
jgi:hypothetical protein